MIQIERDNDGSWPDEALACFTRSMSITASYAPTVLDNLEDITDYKSARDLRGHQPTATCGSCGADIIWAESTSTGRTAPIDADPHPDGNILLRGDGTYTVIPTPEQKEAIVVPLHLNHFVTCPNADSHR